MEIVRNTIFIVVAAALVTGFAALIYGIWDAVRAPRQGPGWNRPCTPDLLARRPDPTPAPPPKYTYCHHCGARQRTGE